MPTHESLRRATALGKLRGLGYSLSIQAIRDLAQRFRGVTLWHVEVDGDVDGILGLPGNDR